MNKIKVTTKLGIIRGVDGLDQEYYLRSGDVYEQSDLIVDEDSDSETDDFYE